MRGHFRLSCIVSLLCCLSISGAYAAGSCPSYRDPNYQVSVWNPYGLPPFCSDVQKRMKTYLSQIDEQQYPHLVRTLNDLMKTTCPGDEAKHKRARGFEEKYKSGMGISGGETGGMGEWPVILTKLIVQRAESEMRMALKDSFLNGICDANVGVYFQNTCRLYGSRSSYGVVPSDALLARTLSNDLHDFPACFIYQQSQTEKQKASAGLGYILVNLLEGIPKQKEVLPLIAGLTQTPAVIEGCKTGLETICGLYFGGAAVAATIRADRNNELIPLYFYDQLLPQRLSKTRDDPSLARAERIAQSKYMYNSERLISAKEDIRKAAKDFSDVPAGDAHRDERLERGLELGLKVVDVLEAASCPTQSLGDDNSGCFASELRAPLTRAYTLSKIVIEAQQRRYAEMAADLRPVLKCLERPGQPGCDVWDPWAVAIRDRSHQKAVVRISENILFAGTLAAARTDEDAVSILDQYASPVGAWRVKREQKVLSAGALLGAAAGGETLTASGYPDQSGYYSGLLIPVGLDVSWPRFFKCRECTKGVFISVLDLGPLVSTTTSDDSVLQVNTDANIGTSQLISPGIYFRVGIGKTPWVVGAGVGYTRGLREATNSGNATVPLDSTRYLIFIGIDVMLMKFGR